MTYVTLARRSQQSAYRVHDNLIHFLRQRPELFPFRRDLDVRHFLTDVLGGTASVLPVPAKIFLVDELQPKAYGFPLTAAAMLDELELRAGKWLTEELKARDPRRTLASPARAADLLASYRELVVKIAENAKTSSILADYHSVFWLHHSQQMARLFTNLLREIRDILPALRVDETDRLRYSLHASWVTAMRESAGDRGGFLNLILDNPLLAAEDAINPDLRELRSYFTGHLRRDYMAFRVSFDELKRHATEQQRDPLFRRAMMLLGYPESGISTVTLLDPRVRQLLADTPGYRPAPDHQIFDGVARKLLEYFIVHALRRGIIWMKTTADGDNVSEDGQETYSRAIRPMNFGRRGVVEPIVYRYGLVYDITSFTQTLGEIARGGKGEEQTSYRQMLEFQRELAEITRRNGLQFEKFLGDGAFYTSRRATRAIHTAVEIQQFYAKARTGGFAFNKGMRIALNYGYYRLLPMQVSTDGTQIMEFYGPGIVELSRLTTGKATKELEDIQHLLLSHGYDQGDVYKFFAPLSRSVGRAESLEQEREFYAFVNENGHLINEGIVVSIPFLKQLSTELEADSQKTYRLRTSWSVYVGFAMSGDGGYIGMRLLGNVSLKGIGTQEIGEVVHFTAGQAEVSIIDDAKSLLQLLQQERNRSAARNVGTQLENDGESTGTADLVVCESHFHSGSEPVILVGEWDPVSEEVRRPIQLDGMEAERYGLAVPLTAEKVESQSIAYQKLYRTLSRIETLPSFSVDAIRHNANFSGFIIGATVEPL
ncbi:MAG TPA: hypothetical protein VGF48_25560 [Thermoanaerobaculia bacterium]